MPARRTPPALKLKLAPHLAVVPEEAAAELAGDGLDFDDVPDVLDHEGRAEWQRLADVFAEQPTRFRDGDRAALVAYCAYWSAFVRAAREVATNGPVAKGRSAKDRARMVKAPATTAMREASTQLRYWARELGLTPDARGRMGLVDSEGRPGDEPNPFMPPDHR